LSPRGHGASGGIGRGGFDRNHFRCADPGHAARPRPASRSPRPVSSSRTPWIAGGSAAAVFARRLRERGSCARSSAVRPTRLAAYAAAAPRRPECAESPDQGTVCHRTWTMTEIGGGAAAKRHRPRFAARFRLLSRGAYAAVGCGRTWATAPADKPPAAVCSNVRSVSRPSRTGDLARLVRDCRRTCGRGRGRWIVSHTPSASRLL